MSGHAGSAMLGQRRGKREVIDVPEKKREDKSLDKLLHVRKQRLDRFERERNEARQAWREARMAMREKNQHWRDAVEAAKTFWQEARAGFFKMATTSGQFRKAKAIYERMKSDASAIYLECHEAVRHCKEKRQAFFDARRQVLQANRQQEKLGILRDEIKLLTTQPEA